MLTPWLLLKPEAEDLLGYLPGFLHADDPRPPAAQFDDRYAHGGGWQPFGQGQWECDRQARIRFPGDPWLEPLAMTEVSGELVVLYPYAMVAIFRAADGTFEVARLD